MKAVYLVVPVPETLKEAAIVGKLWLRKPLKTQLWDVFWVGLLGLILFKALGG